MASPAIAAQLVRAFDLPLDPAELVLRKRMAFRRIAESRMVPFDGLPEEIARWGLPRGLATSSTREDADFMLGRLGFGAAFAPVVTADDVRDAKPAPDCYRLAAERLGRDPGACVALEDTANGMKAALAAGIRVLAVSTLPLSALPPGVLAAFPTTVQALQWLRS
jgi:HAD superfamily hydrolase (TIGR01509 family)